MDNGHAVRVGLDRRVAKFLTDRNLILAFAFLATVPMIAASIPYWHNAFTLSVEAEAVTIYPDARATLASNAGPALGSGTIEISEAASVQGLPPGALDNLSPPLSISANGQLSQTRLQLSPDGALRIVIIQSGLDVFVYRGGVYQSFRGRDKNFEIKVAGKGAEPKPVVMDTVPSIQAASASLGSASPVQLQLPVQGKGIALVFRDELKIANVGFGAERTQAVDGPAFRSGIMKGTLRLRDVKREITLRPHEPIRLSGLKATITSMTIHDDRIAIELTGHANSILVGPPGFDENAAPSVFEYIHGNEGIRVLWLIWVALATAFWGIRGWAQRIEQSS